MVLTLTKMFAAIPFFLYKIVLSFFLMELLIIAATIGLTALGAYKLTPKD